MPPHARLQVAPSLDFVKERQFPSVSRPHSRSCLDRHDQIAPRRRQGSTTARIVKGELGPRI